MPESSLGIPVVEICALKRGVETGRSPVCAPISLVCKKAIDVVRSTVGSGYSLLSSNFSQDVHSREIEVANECRGGWKW